MSMSGTGSSPGIRSFGRCGASLLPDANDLARLCDTVAHAMPVLLEDLRQTLATRPSGVVFIVGTGVSTGALHGNPHPSLAAWAGLLDHGLQRTHELGGLDERTLAHYQQQLSLTFPDALLGVADVVSRGLGAPLGGEFSRWLRETVGAFHDNIRNRDVLEVLADHQRRGALLATTNYDHLLEAVTALKPTTWRRPASVERAIRGAEPRVLHLHGEWEDPESIVLGTRSYVDVARDPHAQAVLAALRTDRTFVFVGCGAGLHDPNLGAFIKWTGEVFAGAEARHFRLCLHGEVEALRREHPPEQRIFPLPYGHTHTDLAPFLRALLPAGTSVFLPSAALSPPVATPPRPSAAPSPPIAITPPRPVAAKYPPRPVPTPRPAANLPSGPWKLAAGILLATGIIGAVWWKTCAVGSPQPSVGSPQPAVSSPIVAVEPPPTTVKLAQKKRIEPEEPPPLYLPKLGLKANAPAESTVNDAIMGTGHMVMGPGLVANVAEASDTQPKSINDAKKEAEMFTPKNLKGEKLADGWVVTFDNVGGMGPNFFAQVRRNIGGKAIWCETTASQAAQQTNAVNFCKSLIGVGGR